MGTRGRTAARRLLLAAASLAAPIPLGSLPEPGAPIRSCSDAATFAAFVQETTGASNAYVVPQAGVITQWTGMSTATTASGRLQLLVFRGSGATRQLVAASQAVPVPGTSVVQRVTRSVRIPAVAGDVIAISGSGDQAGCVFDSGLGAADTIRESAFRPAVPFQRRQVIVFGEPTAGATAQGLRAAVQAELEPDADGDLYGDLSQDKCPTDRTIAAEACPAGRESGEATDFDVTISIPGLCVVPRLRGLSLTRAKVRLRRAGCRLGRVQRPARRGRLVVVAQRPRAGVLRRQGSKVALRLGRRR